MIQLKFWKLNSAKMMKKYKLEMVTYSMIKKIYVKEMLNLKKQG